jgi:four helix bundle protein
MGEVQNYKDLPVVQRAFTLVQAVDTFVHTLPSTPQGRTVGDQLFRAATSIGANIAEGRGRDMGKEYERFLRIARASANETDYWLHVAHDCRLVAEEDYTIMIGLVDECLRMLSTMITRLRNRNSSTREEPAVYNYTNEPEMADL